MFVFCTKPIRVLRCSDCGREQDEYGKLVVRDNAFYGYAESKQLDFENTGFQQPPGLEAYFE